jgi:hypothetical protein
VTVASSSEALNFLLTVHGVRWQARLSGPAGSPVLDRIDLTHAPVSFNTSGSATTTSIGPSTGRAVTAWRSLTATMNMFTPGGGGTGSATARLLDASTGQQVAAIPLNAGVTTFDLSGIPVAAHQSLKAALDLTSDGQATPRISSIKVQYDSATGVVPPPAPPALTFGATPRTIVFGQTAILAGTLTQGGAPLPGQSVALGAQPIGAPTFLPLPPATTDAAGNFRAAVKPTKKTTYKAGFGGLLPEPTATVNVKHKITLKGRRRSGKVYLNGTVGPRHVRRLVLVQRKVGRRWVTIGRVRTSRRSTFRLVRKAPAKRALFRARIAADREHLANISRTARA